MAVYLVRHAKAGSRSDWAQPDELRTLSKGGWAQARGLVTLLRGQPVERVLSSRYIRCLQTVEPLAADRGLHVERHHALAEEAAPGDVAALLEQVAGQHAVLCTHGNIVPLVLDRLASDGLTFEDAPTVWKKGSVWVLGTDTGGYVSARYLRPSR